MQEMIKRAKELLADGTVVRVLGWKRCDLPYNPEPAFFGTEEELDALVYDGFCGANLSKYMIEASKKEGRTLVFLKPCDTYSFNQLVKEHRVDREKAYIIGVGCRGKLDIEAIKGLGIKGIETVEEDGDTLKIGTIYGEKTCAYGDAVLERCKVCVAELIKEAALFGTVSWTEAKAQAWLAQIDMRPFISPCLGKPRPDALFQDKNLVTLASIMKEDLTPAVQGVPFYYNSMRYDWFAIPLSAYPHHFQQMDAFQLLERFHLRYGPAPLKATE